MNVFIQFRIPQELRDKFNRACRATAISRSEWIRQQIEKFVKENEK